MLLDGSIGEEQIVLPNNANEAFGKAYWVVSGKVATAVPEGNEHQREQVKIPAARQEIRHSARRAGM